MRRSIKFWLPLALLILLVTLVACTTETPITDTTAAVTTEKTFS